MAKLKVEKTTDLIALQIVSLMKMLSRCYNIVR